MAENFNIHIDKKELFNKLTPTDIDILKRNIGNLELFFNTVFEILCNGKKKNKQKTVAEVVNTILQQQNLKFSDDIFCMGRTPANHNCNIRPKMFNKDQLTHIITELVTKYNNNDEFIHFICKYNATTNEYDTGSREANVTVGGNPEGNSFINLRDILIENTKHETEIMCIQINDKQICYHNKPTTANKCDFCDKWQKDRELFKQLINEMLEQNQIINIIELMKDNLHLFPAAILDQDRYHYFHTSLEEYKKRLR